ncbi:aldose epimerase family protein [Sphingomonas sp. HT-1]|uniref:aldose epimerase family protein n=1 Tax=unclassified Sphingomonas TaxID=196159 RepID=UPI0002DD3FDC|nr:MULTISPECIES: aldose epimerase family protein [unclassified Sphingomonas]KTF69940.1 galactose mutarotase [Sphingomonas sp. WG]
MSGIEVVEIARGAFRAQFLNLGATLHRLEVPDRHGRPDNVVLGYADLEDYRRQPPRYYGAVAGRYANRIAGGRFALDGETFQLTTNEGDNSLHSGPAGFDQQLWTVESRSDTAVTFRLDTPHGWNGFPGDLTARVEYVLEEDGLAVRFTATTDRATIVNLTQHAYFNLAGEGSSATILEHVLQIPASAITPVDNELIPTGALAPVEGTPFDFRTPKPIGRDIDAADAQLALGTGFDHNFVLDGPAGFERRIATLFDPHTGRVLDVHSTEPGVQFYSGNYLADGAPGTTGGTYPLRGGLCLEPQKFPDSPNQPGFPSARIEAGETYRHSMAFRFRTASHTETAFDR